MIDATNTTKIAATTPMTKGELNVGFSPLVGAGVVLAVADGTIFVSDLDF
jgi:hypothetical protein